MAKGQLLLFSPNANAPQFARRPGHTNIPQGTNQPCAAVRGLKGISVNAAVRFQPFPRAGSPAAILPTSAGLALLATRRYRELTKRIIYEAILFVNPQ